MSNGTVTVDVLENGQMNLISILNLMTSGLSLVGSLSIFMCVIYHKRVCSPEIFPIFHLSVAGCLASVVMMTVSVTFLNSTPTFPGSSGPCGYLIAIMTSFYICTFFLTCGYALEAYIRLRQRLQSYVSMDVNRNTGVSSICMWAVYIFSWFLPITLGVVLMFLSRLHKNTSGSMDRILPLECSLCFPIFSTHQSFCWMYVEDGLQWLLVYRLVFLIPLIFVFALNMGLYLCIARNFRQVSMRRGLLSYHQRQEESTLKKKSAMYQAAFIVCWIPTLVLTCISFSDSYVMADYYPVLVLQAILGPLQGLLNSIIYGWKRNSFRRALTESSHLLSTNRGGTMSFTLSQSDTNSSLWTNRFVSPL